MNKHLAEGIYGNVKTLSLTRAAGAIEGDAFIASR